MTRPGGVAGGRPGVWRVRLTLLVRGLWWRRAASLAVLLVASVVVGAAALGPLFARAVGESTLQDELARSVADTNLQFAVHPYGLILTAPLAARAAGQEQVPAPGQIVGYPRRIASLYLSTSAAVAGGEGGQSALAWRQGVCAHLRIVVGRCPRAAGEVIVSQRTVTAGFGWRVGSTVTTGAGPVRVVGSYVATDPSSSFWGASADHYFDAQVLQSGQNLIDAMFTDRAEFDRMPSSTDVAMQWDFPLDAAAVRLAEVPVLRREIADWQRRRPASGRPDEVDLETNLVSVLDAAAAQRNLADLGTLLVTVQLGLLAWLVLFQVITDSVESRGGEIALAKLRGLRPSWTGWLVLGEPLLLLALAAPLGLGLAWLAVTVFAHAVLVPGTPVAVTWLTGAGVLAGLAGGVLAAVAGSYRALTRSVLAQWRRTSERGAPGRAGRVLVPVFAVVAAAAATTLLVVLGRGREASTLRTLALLAPGMMVVAVALVGTRALPRVARLLSQPTRATARIGAFLATRQVARRPAGMRLAALLVVAIGLAVFAVGGEAMAAVNRNNRAQAEIGAARSVAIQYDPTHNPVDAVRRVDPHGRWAMPVATWLPDGGDTVNGTVLGVDAPRLTSVGYPATGGPSLASVSDAIETSTAPTVRITATRLRAVIHTSAMTGPAATPAFVLHTPTIPTLTVPTRALRPGTATYAAAVPCRDGCTFAGIVFDRLTVSTATMGATITIAALQQRSGGAWHTLPADLTDASRWRAGPEVSETVDTLSAGPGGLTDRFVNDSGYGGITYAYAPDPIPVYATPGALATPLPDPPAIQDGYGTPTSIRIAAIAPVLPIVLDNGIIANLAYLTAELPGFAAEASWSILLGPNAPADATARLTAAGLTLTTPDLTVRQRVTQLGRQAPALSLLLLLACAAVGAIVAVGGTAVAITASARRRSFETAAMRALGVPTRPLYRANVYEQLLLLGAALLLGLPVGVIAARLTAPVIPEFADHTPIAFRYPVPLAATLTLAAAFLALITATALVAATIVVRSGRPSRLREGET